jgi:hypothetical protein
LIREPFDVIKPAPANDSDALLRHDRRYSSSAESREPFPAQPAFDSNARGNLICGM